MIRRRFLVLPLLLVVPLSAPLRADLSLPVVIGSNMVLQRGEAIPIWGTDEPGTAVTVTLGETSVTSVADKNGSWLVKLPSMEAGGPHRVEIAGSSTVTLENVLVGEVWLCSGQSNMEFPVRACDNAEQEIAAATDAQLRHIKIPHVPAETPQENVVSEGWRVCSPETVPNFTAVGYFFGRHLRRELGVPVGLLGSNWGGTRIEPWTPPVGFRSVEALSDIANDLENYPRKNDEGKIQHQSALALYNGMIHPLVPFGIRGALWYQGESNNGEGMLYHEKMKALIAGWRAVWGKPELPFYFVQLAPYRYGGDPTRLPGMWEAQLATLSVPHTGMAVTVDVANITDIHPRNKQDVGKRLALWALAHDYGREGLVYSGPLYKSHTVEGSSVRVRFDHVGGGLVSRDGKPLSWFSIAGEDKKFVDARAEIDGDTVVVSADGVDSPTAVRLGWHQEAEPNLSNKEGLPASPFRTDRPAAIDSAPEK